jgi:hypothetical protein
VEPFISSGALSLDSRARVAGARRVPPPARARYYGRVADDGHEQSTRGIHGHADMNKVFVNSVARFEIEARVELAMFLKQQRENLEQNRRKR